MSPIKTKAMVTIPSAVSVPESATAYRRRYDPTIPTYRRRSTEKIPCSQCNKLLSRKNLPRHLRGVHHNSPYSFPRPLSDSSSLPETYCISMPAGQSPIPCPVFDCPAFATSRERMRRHFCTRHNNDTLIIREEGLLPRCPRCGKFIRHPGPAHFQTKTCHKCAKR